MCVVSMFGTGYLLALNYRQAALNFPPDCVCFLWMINAETYPWKGSFNRTSFRQFGFKVHSKMLEIRFRDKEHLLVL